MLNQTTALAILAAAVVTAGCGDSELRVAGATAPSELQSGNAPFAGITPTSVSAQLSGRGLCPDIHPLFVPLNLTVQANRGVSLNVTEVRMRFVDAFGIAAPPITLAAPMLTRQFGTALVEARSSRSFPLDFTFGCNTARTGTIFVVVHVRDGHGRDDSSEVRVSVR